MVFSRSTFGSSALDSETCSSTSAEWLIQSSSHRSLTVSYERAAYTAKGLVRLGFLQMNVVLEVRCHSISPGEVGGHGKGSIWTAISPNLCKLEARNTLTPVLSPEKPCRRDDVDFLKRL